MYLTEHHESALATRDFAIRVDGRARAADLGLNTVALGCLGATLLVLLLTVPLCAALGLRLDFGHAGWLRLSAAGALLLAWAYYFSSPGRPKEWIIPEVLFALTLSLLLGMVLGPAQYVAAAINRPTVDPWLASFDAALGFHVPSLAAWTWQHPTFNALLVTAYNSFQLQLVALLVVLGFVRDRRALWEYTFACHVCIIVTVVCSAVFPVACAFTYYDFQSTLDFTRFTAHFTGMRDGSMTVIPYGNMDGLISMPSFHAAGGFIMIWATRRHRLLVVLSGAWNSLLIASTMLSGAHYVIDVIAAAVLVVVTIWTYHTLVRPVHPRPYPLEPIGHGD